MNFGRIYSRQKDRSIHSILSDINRLRKEKNVVILAHHYQPSEVQDIADFIGDSLGLSQQASTTNADVIVFAGVKFMAETAKIINPDKKVLLPDLDAGCSLADSCTPRQLAALKAKYPNHVVISYINCSAAIKAMSDIICTSANAEKIIHSVPKDKEIMFIPDKHLGSYLIEKTRRPMLLWDGACVVHEAFSVEKLLSLHMNYPDAAIVAHPESESYLLKAASYVGSTTGMIDFVQRDPRSTFIIATEGGILHEMSKVVPDKKLIPAPANTDNACACSECASMKLTTLEKIANCLANEYPSIEVDPDIAAKARIPIMRMLELSKN